MRAKAAAQRGQAAEDRVRAAEDREAAAADRKELLAELERAHLDELTGAYRRGTGEAVLVNEIDRAKRSGVALVFAYLEVEDPRDGNDREGDTASDAALRNVVTVMQSKLRPYDPVVRWGRGAFLCTITDADLDDAGGRLVEIRNALADSHPSAKVEFGIAALGKDDTLETLIDRADAALQETKRVP